MVLFVIFGLAIILSVLWEAFETVVLPRRVVRRFRVTRLFYRVMWGPWTAIARKCKKGKSRETFLSYFGPLSILLLFAIWAAAIIVAFGMLYYGSSAQDSTHPTFETCLYLSGTTMFTLGLGDVVPHTWAERLMAVFESGIGFGFLALVLSYLPVIYQAFSRREVSIVLLDARAGSPPTGIELLRRHPCSEGAAPLEQVLHDWERAAADMLESHISYPSVSYFRSQHANESWIAALTAILDACTLLMTTVENPPAPRQAKLTFAMCRHTVVDLAQVFGQASSNDLEDRLPPSDLTRMLKALQEAGFRLREDEPSREKFAKLRALYEPYVQALSRYLYMEIPPWILASEIIDNWKTSAWGRISGLALAASNEPDDHSD